MTRNKILHSRGGAHCSYRILMCHLRISSFVKRLEVLMKVGTDTHKTRLLKNGLYCLPNSYNAPRYRSPFYLKISHPHGVQCYLLPLVKWLNKWILFLNRSMTGVFRVTQKRDSGQMSVILGVKLAHAARCKFCFLPKGDIRKLALVSANDSTRPFRGNNRRHYDSKGCRLCTTITSLHPIKSQCMTNMCI